MTPYQSTNPLIVTTWIKDFICLINAGNLFNSACLQVFSQRVCTEYQASASWLRMSNWPLTEVSVAPFCTFSMRIPLSASMKSSWESLKTDISSISSPSLKISDCFRFLLQMEKKQTSPPMLTRTSTSSPGPSNCTSESCRFLSSRMMPTHAS